MASEEAQQRHATEKVSKLSNSNQDVQGPCSHCSKSGHLASACWCKDMNCHSCGKTGRVEWACRNKKSKQKGSKTENKKGQCKTTRRKDMFTQLNMERRGTVILQKRKCLLQ